MHRTLTLEQCKQDILSSFRQRETVITPETKDYSIIDNGYRSHFYSEEDYRLYFQTLTSQVLPEQPVEFRDNFGLYFIIWQESNQKGITYHFIGPYLYQLPFILNDSESFHHFAKARDIPEDRKDVVVSYFSQLPIVKDMSVWKTAVSLFLSHYYEKSITIPTIDYVNKTGIPLLVSSGTDADDSMKYKAIEARYNTENKMLEAITRGDTAEALHYLHEFMRFNLETRGSSELASAKMYIVAANTAFRKAVEAAQVHPLYIDQVSGRLHLEIEQANSMAMLNHINTDMIRRYCALVQTYSRNSYSPLVRNCLYYIDFHFQEPISLESLADTLSVSKNHLSSQFHKEVKQTITDYINTTRVRQAMYLLSTSALSMEQIAEQCGFADSNYFARTFKKIKGISPREYKKSLFNTTGPQLAN